VVEVVFEPSFKKKFVKIKDVSLREKIIKQIEKIKMNPEVGKPMKYSKKGTRELYISPFRLSYSIKSKDLIYILDLYHKDFQ